MPNNNIELQKILWRYAGNGLYCGMMKSGLSPLELKVSHNRSFSMMKMIADMAAVYVTPCVRLLWCADSFGNGLLQDEKQDPAKVLD